MPAYSSECTSRVAFLDDGDLMQQGDIEFQIRVLSDGRGMAIVVSTSPVVMHILRRACLLAWPATIARRCDLLVAITAMAMNSRHRPSSILGDHCADADGVMPHHYDEAADRPAAGAGYSGMMLFSSTC